MNNGPKNLRSHSKKYLQLSRHITYADQAFCEFQLEFNDLLSAEVDGKADESSLIIVRISDFDNRLMGCINCLQALLVVADTRIIYESAWWDAFEYEIRLLTDAGVVEQKCLDYIIIQRSFEAILHDLENDLVCLRQMIRLLRDRITRILESDRLVMEIIENNLPGNFQLSIYNVQTSWLSFQSQYHAFCLAADIAWYLENGRGTLIVPRQPSHA